MFTEETLLDTTDTIGTVEDVGTPETKEPKIIKEPARVKIEEFCSRFLELEHQKKALAEDLKALKEEYKEEGVPVNVVTRVINQIKREKKRTPSEIFEAEAIKEWLLESTSIDDSIGSLIAK